MASSYMPRLYQLRGVSSALKRVHLPCTHRATPCLNKRFASTEPEPIATITKKNKKSPLRKFIFRSSIAFVLFGGYLYFTDTRASAHRYIAVPIIRWLFPDAEDAHHAGVAALRELYKFGLHFRERSSPDLGGKLATQVFGYTLSNPIGISGGLDKHAEIPDPLFALGAAVVEVGGTTPLPQDGNPKPRVFRIVSQSGMINRYGLNSKGADHMAKVLKQRVREFAYANGYGYSDAGEERVLNGEAGVPPGSLNEGKLLAVQVAKNKVTPESDIAAVTRDYVYCVDRVAPYADIVVVNVSSPNTPGLRGLQAAGPLTEILKGVVGAAKRIDRKTKPFVMVKVSPDEDSEEQVDGICHAVRESGVDGVIVGNTTNRRPEPLPYRYPLSSKEEQTMTETGGYSGPQLFERTVALVSRYKQKLSDAGSQKTIFASGGITNGKQAQAVLDAGASVAMMYTAITFGGIGTVTRVKNELRQERSL
ncbi:dihydroorotate reductase PyrE, putative [Talaromyces stipitatus ATCC 10500]|uniref:Dihydroorotate dehydrogenase (quinone), mitochondrial n=1 Tax=Talaromyces stipitatus (strain ATCC 10500 / CBS 375.48 / QM 6759 / NRRL 1006) TaxID=441959 RepID=B8M8U1_TALSN|nr:dihydroorotate reductase PyrE, putative [Talaromyces stipitatus ATCC 10500]EED20604.1 dihydroorotate reductase PyrE, putative [Talaromyces stipitatus ATCC 10500]